MARLEEWDSVRAVLCSDHYFYGQNFQAQSRSGTVLVNGFHICFLRMMWSYWHHQVGIFSSHWRGFQPNVKQRGLMVSDLETLFGVECHLHVGSEMLPQLEEFKYLRVEKELSQKTRLFVCQSTFISTLSFGHELWVVTKGMRS